MLKRYVWLVLAFVLLTVVGCTAETLPAPDAPGEDAPALEPAAETVEVDTPTAEALKKILESELLETPTLPASVTPLLEEVLQLQPTSSKPNPEASQHIAYARNDLAEKLGVDLAAIEVVAYEEITWRDGSLGCPQPGMMYTQALVDGYLIQLQVDGQAYNYHGAQGRDPFLCIDESGTPQSPPPELRGGDLSTPAVQEE